MLDQHLFDHRGQIHQGVERAWGSRSEVVRRVTFYSDNPTGPGMFWQNHAFGASDVVRPESDLHFNHSFALFGGPNGGFESRFGHSVLLYSNEARIALRAYGKSLESAGFTDAI